MADIEVLDKTRTESFLDGTFKGTMYMLFHTNRCNSCAILFEQLSDIMKDAEFRSENLFIVPREYSTWISFVKKYNVRGYPSLVRTFNGKKLDIYSGQNIIKVFKTGLQD